MKTILTILVAGVLLAGNAHAQPQLLQLSPVQEDAAELQRNLAGNSYYLGLAVNQFNHTWQSFWAKDTARLEAMLNALGSAKVGQMINLHVSMAEKINALLDETGSDGPRVNATQPRQLMVDQATGYITVVPLPEEMVDLGEAPNPEPTPTPEPESAFVVEDAPVLASREAARPRFVKAVLSWRE